MSRACGDSKIRRESVMVAEAANWLLAMSNSKPVPPNGLAQGAAQIAGATGGARRGCKPGRWNTVMRKLEPFSCDRPLSPLGPARSGVSAVAPWVFSGGGFTSACRLRVERDSKWLCPARASSAAICAAVDKRHRNRGERCGSGGQTQTREGSSSGCGRVHRDTLACRSRRPGKGSRGRRGKICMDRMGMLQSKAARSQQK